MSSATQPARQDQLCNLHSTVEMSKETAKMGLETKAKAGLG